MAEDFKTNKIEVLFDTGTVFKILSEKEIYCN